MDGNFFNQSNQSLLVGYLTFTYAVIEKVNIDESWMMRLGNTSVLSADYSCRRGLS